jgi:hypothetical protein
MNTFTIYWNRGIKETITGKSLEEAFLNSGYTEKDVNDIFCCEEGETNSFFFGKNQWVKLN